MSVDDTKNSKSDVDERGHRLRFFNTRRRSSRSVRPVEQVHAERRNEIKLNKTDKDLCRLLNALFILPADHSSYNE